MANIQQLLQITKDYKYFMMKNQKKDKIKAYFDNINEKFFEWVEYFINLPSKKKKWKSNLMEVYEIYKEYTDKPFVREFLEEREKNICFNGYKITVRVIDKKSPADTIGTVSLYRKTRLIERATLKTKNNEKQEVIYGSFDK